MTSNIGFARQGELIKLAYDAFGFLSLKSAKYDFDETKKKTIHKRLGKLAREEGHLSTIKI